MSAIPGGRVVELAIRSAALAVGGCALSVIAGYAWHVAALIRLLPHLQGMSVLTASALAAVSGSIVADSLGRRRIGRWLGSGSLLVGLAVLLVQVAGGEDRISPAIADTLFGLGSVESGRTSPATAACLVLLGVAALRRPVVWVADSCGSLALVVSGIALIGYAYGVQDLYAVPVFRTMALHTAVGLFVLALTSLLARPDTGIASIVLSPGSGGRATRRQITFTLLPPVVGLLLLEAIAAHRLGAAAAMAFLVVLTIIPLALLILRDGRALDELERERRRRSDLQVELSQDLQEQLGAQAQELQREMIERAKAEQGLHRAQRMEAMGQLTGGIAHDFNNLLMAIGGNLQLLLKRLPSEHPARRFAVQAKSSTDKGTKLATQLLAFSRTQKLDIRPIDLHAALRNSRELFGPTLGPDIAIRMDLPKRPEWALADPDQLELAVLNLALNARDAMPGGGDLSIETARCRKRLTPADELKEYASIRIRDTGTGMPAAVAAQAFDPFFTTKERGRGSGLGLTQVYGFVRQCGGDITIDSSIGQGTTIELLLPGADSPGVQVPVAEPPVPMAGRKTPSSRPLLLVIDDDDAVRAVLVDALRDDGFTVIEASNGPDGLKLLDGHVPAAAIIDFLMPGLNGAEVARRAQQRQPGLPIIFVSGYYDTIALDEISGAVILRKPIDLDRLQSTVSSVLG